MKPGPAMFEDPNSKWSEIEVFCYGKQIRLQVHQFTALGYHSARGEAITLVLCRYPSGKWIFRRNFAEVMYDGSGKS